MSNGICWGKQKQGNTEAVPGERLSRIALFSHSIMSRMKRVCQEGKASPFSVCCMRLKRMTKRRGSYGAYSLQEPINIGGDGRSHIGSGFSWRTNVDSHASDHFPTLLCKICPPLSEFTSMVLSLTYILVVIELVNRARQMCLILPHHDLPLVFQCTACSPGWQESHERA
jgi:hypothetical protein